ALGQDAKVKRFLDKIIRDGYFSAFTHQYDHIGKICSNPFSIYFHVRAYREGHLLKPDISKAFLLFGFKGELKSKFSSEDLDILRDLLIDSDFCKDMLYDLRNQFGDKIITIYDAMDLILNKDCLGFSDKKKLLNLDIDHEDFATIFARTLPEEEILKRFG